MPQLPNMFPIDKYSPVNWVWHRAVAADPIRPHSATLFYGPADVFSCKLLLSGKNKSEILFLLSRHFLIDFLMKPSGASFNPPFRALSAMNSYQITTFARTPTFSPRKSNVHCWSGVSARTRRELNPTIIRNIVSSLFRNPLRFARRPGAEHPLQWQRAICYRIYDYTVV